MFSNKKMMFVDCYKVIEKNAFSFRKDILFCVQLNNIINVIIMKVLQIIIYNVTMLYFTNHSRARYMFCNIILCY